MKKVFLFLAAFSGLYLMLVAQPVLASTEITDSEITVNTTWTKSGSPYVLKRELSINNGAVLTIDPGVIVKFDGATGLVANSQLIAVGTKAEPIYFTSNNNDSLGGDTNGDGNTTEPSAEDYWWIIVRGAHSRVENADVTFSSNGLAVEADPDSIKNVIVSHGGMGIEMRNANADLSGLNMYDMTSGGLQVSDGNITVADSSFSGTGQGIGINMSNGIFSVVHSTSTGFSSGVNLAGNFDATIADSVVTRNVYGFKINNPIIFAMTASLGSTPSGQLSFGQSALHVSQNTISDNSRYGVLNSTFSVYDFRNNWWGDASGPYNAGLHATGTGNGVSQYVDFTPWLIAPPGLLPPAPICCSNVAFIPGIESSRLYKQQIFENELWVPNINADVEKLYMDTGGNSVDPSIYTRDIIGTSFGVHVYDKFIGFMDSLVSDKNISRWQAMPYDWRYDVDTVAGSGVKNADGTISYAGLATNATGTGTLPYMIKELTELALDSKNGKVTIVTHSNGGLVVKALLKHLEEMKTAGQSTLIDSIDKVIMVAAPELGTPESIGALLHGDGQDIFHGIFLDKQTARKFGENLPMSYGLLPGIEYFSQPSPVVVFASSTDSIVNFRQVYGDTITSQSPLNSFLLATNDHRQKPEFSDLLKPNVLNTRLLNKAEIIHSGIDNWLPPSSTSLVKVFGTGVDTVSGIKYEGVKCGFFTRVTCTDGKFLDHKPILNQNGDGTVLVNAKSNIGESLYLDMGSINSEHGLNIQHKDIMNTTEVDQFIKNQIMGVGTLPDHISPVAPLENGQKRIVFGIHSPATIDLYDQAGRHTGLITNPNPDSDLTFYEANIPNTNYFESGEGKYVSQSGGDGEITAKVQGTGTGLFTLTIETTESGSSTSLSFEDIPVSSSTQAELVISPNATSTILKIDSDGDGHFDEMVNDSKPLSIDASISLLRSTIRTLKLPKLIQISLLVKADLAKSLLAKHKPVLAKMTFNLMQKEIMLLSGKKISVADADGLIAIIKKIISLI